MLPTNRCSAGGGPLVAVGTQTCQGLPLRFGITPGIRLVNPQQGGETAWPLTMTS
jgi:hypothetical protein